MMTSARNIGICTSISVIAWKQTCARDHACMDTPVHACCMHTCKHAWMQACWHVCPKTVTYNSNKNDTLCDCHGYRCLQQKKLGRSWWTSMLTCPLIPIRPKLKHEPVWDIATSSFFFARSAHSWRTQSTLDCEGMRGRVSSARLLHQLFFCRHRS